MQVMANEHWVETPLEKLVFYKKGKKPKTLLSQEFTDSLPYINIEAFETGVFKQYADIETSNICKNDDILVVWDGARFGLSGKNQIGAIGSTIMCLSPIIVNSQFLFQFIKSKYSEIQQNPKGTGIPHVNPEVFWNFMVPLPPLSEQQRIVEKLDAILPRIKEAKARLEKIPVLIKRFRQSVLSAACSGKLTGEWREKNPVTLIEFINDNPLEELNFDIPQNWKAIRLVNLCNGFQYGTASKSLKEGRIPVIRMGNLQSGKVLWNDLKFSSDENDIRKYKLNNGDVLFNRTNSPDLVGKTSIFQSDRDAIFAGYLIKIKNKKEILDSNYLNICLNADYAREWCKSVKTDGVSQSNINAQILSNFLIPLTSIQEQQEIVHRVEKLLVLADSLEAKYNTAMQRIEKIEQSVLAKAFRGELVPQNPNDEPAEELLKRIMEEKNKIAQGKTKKDKKNHKKSLK
jgi:type I restriction enzyme S subunit